MNNRIIKHPILDQLQKVEIEFSFNGKPLKAFAGEMVSSALFANGIKVFGRHHKDNSPQGIFCANGQCAQCLVIVDGNTVKACITEIKPGMKISQLEGLPILPENDCTPSIRYTPPKEIETDVLIMGGGPAGLSAAVELAKKDLKIIIADDKNVLGGKLSLQTHIFFNPIEDGNVGTRGIDIANILITRVTQFNNIEAWANSPVVGVFSDKKIGIVKNNRFVLVKPKIFLVAAGAREKTLAFPGSDLPGVYGAGAFQTLVNRDRIKAADKLFIVGGGNIGLITAYHALQAGIKVLGVVEAMPQCGGYKIHVDKIKRFGIPVWTSTTVIKAEGQDKLEAVITAQMNKTFKPVFGTERKFEVDTLLIAVGLSPVNEMTQQAEEFGIKTYVAGDANFIAEASVAIFGGRIVGRTILKDMGFNIEIPPEWDTMAMMLRSKPGKIKRLSPKKILTNNSVYPIIRCVQEIPCNLCISSCALKSIKINSDSIMGTPEFKGPCRNCLRCVSVCQGLAITIVNENYDSEKQKALVIIPWELLDDFLKIGEAIITTGFEGEVIGKGKIIAIKESKWQDKRKLLYVETPFDEAKLVAGIKLFDSENRKHIQKPSISADNSDIVICKCERVTKKQIVDKIKSGCRDVNALKAELRIGMGPCGGKRCINLIWSSFREMGIKQSEVIPNVYRPFELDIPLKFILEQ